MKNTFSSDARFPRRQFLTGTLAAGSAAVMCGAEALNISAAEPSGSEIVVFSKIYQELKLGFEDAAALTAETGLDGIDCPVRPGGEVLPERAAEDLPRYAEVLRRHKLKMPLLTTAITGTASPAAETLLRTARQLGAQWYRLGFIMRQSDVSKQISEVRAQLTDLAALNKEIGIGALLQNHSPSGKPYLAGDLSEMERLVDGFDPAQLGVAFDIGHALVVHGDGWRKHFEALRPHFKIAYVKDVKRAGGWVPFGEGDIAATGYFKLLKEMGYKAPISMHIEFDWAGKGKAKTREGLATTLKQSLAQLKRWVG